MVNGVYLETLIFSVCSLVLIYEIILVGFQYYSDIPQVAVIWENMTKNVLHWVKMGAL